MPCKHGLEQPSAHGHALLHVSKRCGHSEQGGVQAERWKRGGLRGSEGSRHAWTQLLHVPCKVMQGAGRQPCSSLQSHGCVGEAYRGDVRPQQMPVAWR